MFVHFEEAGVIQIGYDDPANVVRLAGISSETASQALVPAERVVGGLDAGWILHVSGQEAQQVPDLSTTAAESLKEKWATPLLALWAIAPPNSSLVTVSRATALMTWAGDEHAFVFSTMKIQSVSAGE